MDEAKIWAAAVAGFGVLATWIRTRAADRKRREETLTAVFGEFIAAVHAWRWRESNADFARADDAALRIAVGKSYLLGGDDVCAAVNDVRQALAGEAMRREEWETRVRDAATRATDAMRAQLAAFRGGDSAVHRRLLSWLRGRWSRAPQRDAPKPRRGSP